MLEDSLSDEGISNIHLPARYKLEGVLAKGGMGLVLKAEDSFLQRSVAIKLIQFERFADAAFQERFVREARTLSSLDHPNIVKVLNHGVSESGVPYCVMELLKGQTLAAFLLEHGVLSLGQFHSIFTQLLDGLSEAHKHNIVHRDLNSKNIVLVQDMGKIQPKIIDFGISRIEEDNSMAATALTGTGKLLGNPTYMSPEQCSGKIAIFSSDIYSLGCLMYECLSGNHPFQGMSAMDLMYKHVNEIAPAMEQMVSDKRRKTLAKLIDRCMKKNPGERPASAEELKIELEQIFQSITEPDEIFINTARSRTQSKKPLIPILLVVALLAGVLAFFYLRIAGQNKVAEVPVQADDDLELATKHCNQLKQEMDKAFRSESKNLLQRRLANELKYLADIQIKSAKPGREAAVAAQAEETLSQALALTNNRADLVELPLRRAECKSIAGNFTGAKKDFDLAEVTAIQLNNGRVGGWLQIMSLSRLANHQCKTKNIDAANQTIDKLIGFWSNSNNDVNWDSPLETPIGTRNSRMILDLTAAKFDTPQERIIQLTIINKVSKTILGHIESDTLSKRTRRTTVQNTSRALLLARNNIIPNLPAGAESERLSKQTSELIAEYKPMI